MPSSRAWRCPECLTYDASPTTCDLCDGQMVEVVVTPVTETRKGWMQVHRDGSFTVGSTAMNARREPVLVAPMPDEARDDA